MSEKRFKALVRSIEKEYRKKGDSLKKSVSIAKATAGEIAHSHHLKRHLHKKRKKGSKK